MGPWFEVVSFLVRRWVMIKLFDDNGDLVGVGHDVRSILTDAEMDWRWTQDLGLGIVDVCFGDIFGVVRMYYVRF